MSEENVLERLARFEERLEAFRVDMARRVEALEAVQARLAWIVVGGVVTALLTLVVTAGGR